jgi:3-hydroxyisobutyrate dehydrogenase-like beta-hydroxyacid dehydrogenase
MNEAQPGGGKPRLGIVGLGRMGRAIATRLAAQGHAVCGWTRSGVAPEAANALRIAARADISALATTSDVIMLSLSDDAAVTSVVEQLCRGGLAGKLVVDTSTVGPDTLRRQAGAIAKAGGAALDAPISGGPDLVFEGRAGFYIGGDAADVARFMPMAEALSNRMLHVGDLGAGAAAKIVNNMMLMGYWETLKEALLIGKSAGLPLETILEVLKGSPAASGAFLHRLPVLLRQSDAVGFTVSGVVKDGGIFRRTAEQYGVPIPVIEAALASFRAHQQKGHGETDLATMPRAAYDEA